MIKKRRVYISRVVGDQVMTSADLERLHKYMLEIEGIDHISDEMRAVVEELWPELAQVAAEETAGLTTATAGRCPLFPRKRTNGRCLDMSALCQKRT